MFLVETGENGTRPDTRAGGVGSRLDMRIGSTRVYLQTIEIKLMNNLSFVC